MDATAQLVVADNVPPDGNGYTWIHQLVPDGQTIIEGPGGLIRAVAGGSVAGLRHDRFAPNEGQTTFVLSVDPGAAVMVFLNGVKQRREVDYELAGRVISWLDLDQSLSSSDELEVFY